MIISEERLERALVSLAETDEKFAHEKADVERSEIVRKRTRARIFLSSEGNVENRKAQAEIAPETITADDDYIAALTTFETTKAKRQREEIVIDVFRTLEASRRKA